MHDQCFIFHKSDKKKKRKKNGHQTKRATISQDVFNNTNKLKNGAM